MKIVEQLRCLFLDNRTFRNTMEMRDRKIVLSVGYGVLADVNVSIRLAAYLLPSIYLADYLYDRGNEVQMRIYFAEHAAPIVLGRNVDRTEVRQWVQSAVIRLNWFLGAFSGVKKFSIATDRAWDGKLAKTIDRLARISWPKGISKRVERYPCPKESMRYLAAHALYMLDPLDIPFCPILESEVDALEGGLVIVVGGPQERFTSEVRDHLRRQLGVHKFWENWTLETPIGRLPPYYRREPDICWSNLRNYDLQEIWRGRSQFDTDAFADFEYLAAHCFGGEFESRKFEESFVLGLDELRNRWNFCRVCD
ncbi:hypothetical protein D4R52_02505 [bacterium]|nr:MAG: hypothetical protein D4R52_02505 [bacterium]